MELLDVVDENGNPLGQVIERNKVYDLDLLHLVVSVLVVNNSKQVLIQKRSANKKYSPNKWGVCSGHVEAGETPVHAALRELEEEIGFKCEANELKVVDENLLRRIPGDSKIMNYYYVYSDKNEDEFVIQKEELSAVKWITIDELIDKIKNHSEEFYIKEDRLPILEKMKSLMEEE